MASEDSTPDNGKEFRVGYLYRTTHRSSGKIYVGMKEGWPEKSPNYLGSGTHIKRAVKKHGPKAFNKMTLVIGSHSYICYLEETVVNKSFVARTDTYNLVTGGRYGIPGQETRTRMSLTQNRPDVRERNANSVKAAWQRPGVKEKHAAATREALRQPETKIRHKAGVRAALNRPEVREKISINTKAALNQPKVKAKMSAAGKANWQKPGAREKFISSFTVAQNRPGVRARNSAAQRIAQNRPGVRARNSANQSAAWQRSEVRAKHSLSRRTKSHDPIYRMSRGWGPMPQKKVDACLANKYGPCPHCAPTF